MPVAIPIPFATADEWRGTAGHYKLDPPYIEVDCDNVISIYEYVIVSAVTVPFSGPETYVFPADQHGRVLSWLEIEGVRGVLDHAIALDAMGYTIASNEISMLPPA